MERWWQRRQGLPSPLNHAIVFFSNAACALPSATFRVVIVLLITAKQPFLPPEMLHFPKRFTRVSSRAFSSADHLGHFIDGITHPRSPPASRSSNPCSLRRNSASPPPLWLPTHSVFNQAPPLQNFDAFSSDRALVECIRALHDTFPTQTPSDGPLLRSISDFAASSSSQIIHEHAFLAHANPPVLSTHDRTGIRRDHVEYHPSCVPSAWRRCVCRV
jgi:hypothetical protein